MGPAHFATESFEWAYHWMKNVLMNALDGPSTFPIICCRMIWIHSRQSARGPHPWQQCPWSQHGRLASVGSCHRPAHVVLWFSALVGFAQEAHPYQHTSHGTKRWPSPHHGSFSDVTGRTPVCPFTCSTHPYLLRKTCFQLGPS